MDHKIHQARVAALSLAQCATAVTLLRANGENQHAERMEAAISATVTIVSDQLGKDTVAQAMRWAADRLDNAADPAGPATTRH